MRKPETRYVRTDDGIYIAYQVIGDGDLDVVFAPGFINNVDAAWDVLEMRGLLEGLASLGRLIVFDRRGTGLSDRPGTEASLSLELGVNDLTAVMGAAGSERALLFGTEDGGMLSAMFAAAHPDRVVALVLFSPWVKGRRSADYPWAWSETEQRAWDESVESQWGTNAFTRSVLEAEAPSRARDDVVERWAAFFRASASPGAVLAIERMQAEIDARSILPTISVPTLSLRPSGDRRPLEEAKYVTGLIPGAILVEFPGESLAILGDTSRIVDEVRRFVNGVRDEQRRFDRYLATVLFTDIVGSTRRAAELGDADWKRLVERHHAIVRAMIGRYGGVEIDTAGDGFFATFDGPARAVACAQRIIEALAPTGLEIRAGVHTGEVETIDGKIGGLGVVIGARVGALADASQILVSQTVKDLVAGSGLRFVDAGERELKGVPDRWRVYEVVDRGGIPP